jgi:hypothetical protein
LFSINYDSICSVLVSSIISVAAVVLISFFNFLFGQCKGKKFQDPLDLALLFVGGEVNIVQAFGYIVCVATFLVYICFLDLRDSCQRVSLHCFIGCVTFYLCSYSLQI